MKKLIAFILITFLISCSGIAQKSDKKNKKKYVVEKTASEWKKQLNSLQYYILREAGTERPFISPLNDNKEVGVYVCAACETPLYDSAHKFDSGTGWPSFYDVMSSGAVKVNVDRSHGMLREEVLCGKCDAHLGHVFSDGPQPTGLRYCINSLSLDFEND